jgi:hypothetical protein
MYRKKIGKFNTLIVVILLFAPYLYPQVDENDRRYVRIGSLQSYFSAYGSERAWNGSYYEGLIWPADYTRQDNAVIKRSFFAIKDFTDEKGYNWEYWASNWTMGNVGYTVFPVELKQIAKFEPPRVYVNGIDITAPYRGDVDSIDVNQIPDRIIINTVNTACGLTITRKILAFSQQYHDNYFIKEWTLENTGNTDYDSEIELTGPLKGIRIGWSTRYSCCREGAYTITDGSQSWGKHSWVTKRGENYPQHINEEFNESDPIQDWLRAGFSYLGQNPAAAHDFIGAPMITGTGRLCSPQHVGTCILYVPKSAVDSTDNPYQPSVLGWHAGDTYPSVAASPTPAAIPSMKNIYDFLSGVPYGGSGMGGITRMDEEFSHFIEDKISPFTVHGDGGGTNVWIGYGPFDLEHDEKLTFVEVEAINGLSREMCEIVGRMWKKAKDNPGQTFVFKMPDGLAKSGTYNDGTADEYKNEWVFTGKDSIMLAFGRAKRNYDSGYNIPQPPLPPTTFEVNSGGDKIMLKWTPSPSIDESDFAGYRIYRAIGKPDTTYSLIAELPENENSFNDVTAVRGFAYYYYITAVNDGSNNSDGKTGPTGLLESGRFYTRTTEPAYLLREQGRSLDDIRIVPNPYNIRAVDLQFGKEEPDKIMFYNIPGKCKIKIYSERGDLIETINHTDGSGDESWNSISSYRQVVVSGLYIAYFEVTEDVIDQQTGELLFKEGDGTYRKFIIIR